MPIPEFDETTGNLPAGCYDVTLEEVRDRFAYNRRRAKIFGGLTHVLSELAQRGCSVAWIDGSYVTDRIRPGDVDIVFKPPPDYGPHWGELHNSRHDQLKTAYLVDLWTFDSVGDVSPGLPSMPIVQFFCQDRDGYPKGILRVKLASGRTP